MKKCSNLLIHSGCHHYIMQNYNIGYMYVHFFYVFFQMEVDYISVINRHLIKTLNTVSLHLCLIVSIPSQVRQFYIHRRHNYRIITTYVTLREHVGSPPVSFMVSVLSIVFNFLCCVFVFVCLRYDAMLWLCVPMSLDC